MCSAVVLRCFITLEVPEVGSARKDVYEELVSPVRSDISRGVFLSCDRGF